MIMKVEVCSSLFFPAASQMFICSLLLATCLFYNDHFVSCSSKNYSNDDYDHFVTARFRRSLPAERTDTGAAKSNQSKIIENALTGGYLGYEGGRKSQRIAVKSENESSMVVFNRKYFFGRRNYVQVGKADDYETCIYKIPYDSLMDFTYEDTNEPVTEILYHCKRDDSERCCDGLDCCPKPLPLWVLLLSIFIVIILAIALICCITRNINCDKCTRRNA
uniref:CX domain-containing protein n=1 Tax=Romanomermis culicivorax TaxID=13658 RepID=A0A915J5P8_ROMCU